MCEIWRDVVGYKGIYQISNLGGIRSLDRISCIGRKLKGRTLKSGLASNDYLCVSLSNVKVKTRTIHQLVCESFIGPCPEGMEVCHGPNGKLDNSLANLRYGTRSENAQDRFRYGVDTCNRIAVICGNGREFISAREAGRLTNCHYQNINKCCRGKRKTAGGHTWKYKNKEQ